MTALVLPPLRRTAADAARFAAIVHEGQVDKAGRPYVEHLSRVAAGTLKLAEGCTFWSAEERDDAVQIAWLHDVVEDTPYSFGDLLDEGFEDPVLSSVVLLTKSESRQPYVEWVTDMIEDGYLATILVKLADVTDNSDPERLALLPEKDRERLARKYAGAADMLREAARARGWKG